MGNKIFLGMKGNVFPEVKTILRIFIIPEFYCKFGTTFESKEKNCEKNRRKIRKNNILGTKVNVCQFLQNHIIIYCNMTFLRGCTFVGSKDSEGKFSESTPHHQGV